MIETFWLLFSLFFVIGFFGFGSGFAMLPLIFQTVKDYGFLTADEFSRMVVIAPSLPGPVSVNAVSYTGFIVAGVPGAIISVLAIACPSFILMTLVMKFLDRYQGNWAIDAVFAGIRPVTVGLIGAAAVMISENTLYMGSLISKAWVEAGLAYIEPVPFIIFAAVFVLMLSTKISPYIFILISVAAGALFIR